MPHFTRQIETNGPILNVLIGVSKERAAALSKAGETVPSQRITEGLVDTGASCTCIDPRVMKALKIPPSGKAKMVTPSTGAGVSIVDQYDVSLAIYSRREEPPFKILNLPIIESELQANQGFDVLIGRDVLARCILHYNGEMGVYTLAF